MRVPSPLARASRAAHEKEERNRGQGQWNSGRVHRSRCAARRWLGL